MKSLKLLAILSIFVAMPAFAGGPNFKGRDITARNAVLSGDLTVAGTFNLPGTDFDSLSVATDKFTVDGYGSIAVATNKFTVAGASGNTLAAGTLSATGNFAVNTDKFTVTAASGNTAVAGTLGVTGNVAVNTDKFTVAAASGNTVVAGTLAVAGAVTGLKPIVVVANSATTTVTAAQSGTTFFNTATADDTTTFNLPTAAAGLTYCFVHAGHADQETLIGVQAGDSVFGKTHAAQDGTAISTAAGTGIKNTDATNVVGDAVCLVSPAATKWFMTSVIGLWASR